MPDNEFLLRGLSAPPDVPMFKQAANYQRTASSYIFQAIVGLVTVGVGALAIELWHKSQREEIENAFAKAGPGLLTMLDAYLTKPELNRTTISIDSEDGSTLLLTPTTVGFALTDPVSGESYTADVPLDTLRTRLAMEIHAHAERYGDEQAENAGALLECGLNASEDWSSKMVQETLTTKVLDRPTGERAQPFERLLLQVVGLDNASPQKPGALAVLAGALSDLPIAARPQAFDTILKEAAGLADAGSHKADEALVFLSNRIGGLPDAFRPHAVETLLAQVVQLDVASPHKGMALAALSKQIGSLPQGARLKAYESIMAQVAKLDDANSEAKELSIAQLAREAFTSLDGKSQVTVFPSTLAQVMHLNRKSWHKGPALKVLITTLWVLSGNSAVRTFKEILHAVNQLGNERHKEEAMEALTAQIFRLPPESHEQIVSTMWVDVNKLANGSEHKRKAQMNLGNLETNLRVYRRT